MVGHKSYCLLFKQTAIPQFSGFIQRIETLYFKSQITICDR
ncbi:hypothetical protein C943_04106 [Mariniradius saccharolyticus AK6]|uniref:Uncharacterized protein n=1 Tax=Mariniradius saccharolyticus AK6 TaxID=1239962 RepID=M7XZ78_9BACT|nr:hypothetical protein C943_04106 [Mariniradius saccharolyticus AK6]